MFNKKIKIKEEINQKVKCILKISYKRTTIILLNNIVLHILYIHEPLSENYRKYEDRFPPKTKYLQS